MAKKSKAKRLKKWAELAAKFVRCEKCGKLMILYRDGAACGDECGRLHPYPEVPPSHYIRKRYPHQISEKKRPSPVEQPASKLVIQMNDDQIVRSYERAIRSGRPLGA